LSAEYNPSNVNLENVNEMCDDLSIVNTLVKGWQESCNLHYARLKGNDVEFCKNKFTCLEPLALEANDSSICGESANCWWDLAWTLDDISLCSQIPSDETARNCQIRFAYEKKDPELCDDLSTKDSCYVIAMRGVMNYEKFIMY